MSPCQGYTYQWRIKGRGPGSSPPPLFLDQTEARRAEKKIFETGLPLYLGVWKTAPPPPPLSEGLDPPLHIAPKTSSILATGG